MTDVKEPQGPRSISRSVTISAPPSAVWRALTDAEELRRWFPVDARVMPEVGGTVWMSWGPGCEGESRIEIWEPERHLRLVEPTAGPDTSPVPIVVDYHLEVRDDCLVLPLNERVGGTVVLQRAPTHLAAVLPGLDDALLFIELESGAEAYHCGTYLSTYGLAAARVGELDTAFREFLNRALRRHKVAPS
jgi:uncharacterized protein YndB with AHSA1/START domain